MRGNVQGKATEHPGQRRASCSVAEGLARKITRGSVPHADWRFNDEKLYGVVGWQNHTLCNSALDKRLQSIPTRCTHWLASCTDPDNDARVRFDSGF